MKLGFIGIGNISSDVVTGICNSKISFKKITLSPRNKKKSRNLKKKFNKIYIAKTNQEVIDKSDWIFIGVLPEVGEKIIAKFGNKNYSRLSIITRSKLKVENFFYVSKNCFYPKPKIDSIVISFNPISKNDLKLKSLDSLEYVTRVFFFQ